MLGNQNMGMEQPKRVQKFALNNLQKFQQANGKCSTDLLEVFGITIDKELPHEPRVANAKDKGICRMNRASCCYADEIMSIQD